MTLITPHINTLIVQIGNVTSFIGYAGDFLPTYFVNSPGDTIEGICQILKEYLNKTGVDSLLYVEPDNFSNETKTKIIKFIFSNKLAQSICFLNNRVAEAFGTGKTTASILSCSSSKVTSSIVSSGKLIEFNSFGSGEMCIRQQFIEMINSKDLEKKILNDIDISDPKASINYVFTSILESKDKINILKTRYNIDIFDIFKSTIIESIENINNLRISKCMNKKNTSNGCILLTGGMFRYEPFYQFVKQLIFDKIGDDFADFILRDKDLINSFAGASVFGMDNHTKQLFITLQDWQSNNNDISKIKCF